MGGNEMIEEYKNGEQERVIVCKTTSKRLNHITEWLVDEDSHQMKLISGEKARSESNIKEISKTILEEHRKEVKEYLMDNQDESEYAGDEDEDSDDDSDEDDSDDSDEDDSK